MTCINEGPDALALSRLSIDVGKTKMNFARSAFGQFMANPYGRGVRVIAGIAFIVLGFWLGTGWGIALAVVGLVPLLAGLFDVCVFSALFGGPFSGEKIRALIKRV